ncbi:MAG: FAD-binding protein, partial [Clostridia bacterium]|nr:FAD-binding protein [Clostridia bacterium]
MYNYTEEQLQSMKKVEQTRASRIEKLHERMTAEEKDAVLAEFHPDYIESAYEELKVGKNKGGKVLHELATLLQGRSRVLDMQIDLTKPDYDVDVLVIGGGGAGSSAAIEAHDRGANVMIVTKLRFGDANTARAEGGIQAADKP